MIVFYKTPFTLKNDNNTKHYIKAGRRVNTKRKVSKNNKKILKALGFKI